MLKKLENHKEIKEFGRYKVELIKEHQYYANNLGLQDMVVDKYNINYALRHIGKKNYYQFLIIHIFPWIFFIITNNKQSIGMVEYKIENSKIDNKEILYLKDIYIKKEFRGKGLGREVLNELKKLNHRIELECWYGMPANNFYKSFGFKELKTRYMIDSE